MSVEPLSTETLGDPPCNHDAYTPCPPECREAKEQWRRKAMDVLREMQEAENPSTHVAAGVSVYD